MVTRPDAFSYYHFTYLIILGTHPESSLFSPQVAAVAVVLLAVLVIMMGTQAATVVATAAIASYLLFRRTWWGGYMGNIFTKSRALNLGVSF